MVKTTNNQENKSSGDSPWFLLSIYTFIFLAIAAAVVTTAFYVYVYLFGKEVLQMKNVDITTGEGIKKTVYSDDKSELQSDGRIRYENEKLGIEFEYPQNWEMKNGDGVISLKKYNDVASKGSSSLAEALLIGRIENMDASPLVDVLKRTNRKTDIRQEKDEVNGEKVYEFEHKVDELNRHEVSHYFIKENWVYYIDTIYYNKIHNHEKDAELKRIMDSIKFK